MSQKQVSDTELQAAVDAVASSATKQAAADKLGIPVETLKHREKQAQRRGITAAPNIESDDNAVLRARVKTLEHEINAIRRDRLSDEWVKRKIFKLSDYDPEPPKWLQSAPKKATSPGVPTLFASDWHWGENVQASQIGGVNTFNLEIAHARAKALIDNAIILLRDHLAYPDYPGIVFALGGDMISGDIHEELSVSNDLDIMPCVLDIADVLITCIDTLADEFGKVFVPCVTGNHGRNTKKIRAKGRNYTSFDWLIYQFLARHFQRDMRITFQIPDGPDALYRIYRHRYLLTHGDQFRGGDGMIGALGPILRGDHKKRSRNAQVDQEYDTMLMGHWHQLIQLKRVIVNGSLKGYCDYAYANNFPYEEPAQALWLTHPTHGITFSMPVYPERERASDKQTAWVSVAG